jgi:hypothetical protein
MSGPKTEERYVTDRGVIAKGTSEVIWRVPANHPNAAEVVRALVSPRRTASVR